MKPLDIVLKMTKCNQQDVAKISDSPEKTLCENTSYLSYLKEVFEKKPELNTKL